MSLENVEIPRTLGNYVLQEKLGAGFSGAIYRAQNTYTGQLVAVKIQHKDDDCPTNRYERRFYPDLQGGLGMPTLWTSGVQGPLDYLVIDLLGPSLDNLFRKSGKATMDLGSVCSIAMQIISRLEFMHSRGILHRDIQLGNAVVGLPPNERTIYMIDFGFSKRYIDHETRMHIPDSKHKRDFIGNYWFTSVNVHCRGRVPTRRDDLEAVALMLIHMLTPGGLHWTRRGVPRTDPDHDLLKREKREARPEDLCRGLPDVFEEFLHYCRRLKFAQQPDYQRWVEEFRALAVEEGYPESEQFVWPAPPRSVKRKTPLQSVRRTPNAEGNVEKVLQDLAGLHLDARPVLGDRTAIVNAANQVRAEGSKPAKSAEKVPLKSPPGSPATDVIVITDSDSSDDVPTRARDKIPDLPQGGKQLPKAVRLRALALEVPRACDNLALARVVADFVAVLQEHSARNLTKEGFAVLDALHAQLADPDVFAVAQPPVPLRRGGRARAAAGARDENGEAGGAGPGQTRMAKANKLWTLRKSVASAGDNAALGVLVAEFGAVTDRSNGRTITKDGFAFLDGLGARLKQLR